MRTAQIDTTQALARGLNKIYDKNSVRNLPKRMDGLHFSELADDRKG